MAKKFYKLAENQSIFWDPTQSEESNQKLVSNWCLPLEETDSMLSAKRHERIVLAEKEEVDAYYKSIGEKVPVDKEEKPEEKPEPKGK